MTATDPIPSSPPEGRIDLRHLSPGDARRLSEILLVLARHGVLVVARRGPTVVIRPRRSAPKAVAVALRRSAADLGPTFVKLGQLIASSPGLFPELLSTEFRSLLDRVPPVPSAHVRHVVEEELGAPIDVLFARFCDTPLASASIAQVHEAELHDGRRVAVKVRRPRLAPRITGDLRLLRLLATTLQRAGTLGQLANPVAIVDDFAATLRAELDFRNEATAMTVFDRNLRRSAGNERVSVPEVVDGLVTERVIVMTFVEGHPVDDVAAVRAAGHDPTELLRMGVRAWLEGAMVHGLFHGDVHAGNLFVTPAGGIAFLDFGITGTLDERTRAVLVEAIPAVLVSRDFPRVVRALFELGAATGPIDVAEAAADVEALVTPLLDRPLAEIAYGDVLAQVLRVATRHRVRLPREMVLVVKQLLYFERYAKEMAPDYQILADPELLGYLVGAPAPPPS